MNRCRKNSEKKTPLHMEEITATNSSGRAVRHRPLFLQNSTLSLCFLRLSASLFFQVKFHINIGFEFSGDNPKILATATVEDKALDALAIEDKKRQYVAAKNYLEDVLHSALATSDFLPCFRI